MREPAPHNAIYWHMERERESLRNHDLQGLGHDGDSNKHAIIGHEGGGGKEVGARKEG